jgi:hypothetical protein
MRGPSLRQLARVAATIGFVAVLADVIRLESPGDPWSVLPEALTAGMGFALGIFLFGVIVSWMRETLSPILGRVVAAGLVVAGFAVAAMTGSLSRTVCPPQGGFLSMFCQQDHQTGLRVVMLAVGALMAGTLVAQAKRRADGARRSP